MNRLSNKGGKRHNVKKAVLAVTAASFLWFVGIGSAFADQPEFTSGVYNNPGFDNVYVGPYPITVNGTLSSLVRDDFSTEIYVGDPWTATANTLNDLPNMKFIGNFGNGVIVYTPNPTSASQEVTSVKLPINAAVPKSSPILLLGTGLLGCAAFSRFRRRSATRKKREGARLAEASPLPLPVPQWDATERTRRPSRGPVVQWGAIDEGAAICFRITRARPYVEELQREGTERGLAGGSAA